MSSDAQLAVRHHGLEHATTGAAHEVHGTAVEVEPATVKHEHARRHRLDVEADEDVRDAILRTLEAAWVRLGRKLTRGDVAQRIARASAKLEAPTAAWLQVERLPADAVVPARIVLPNESAERVRELVTRPPRQTSAMKRLFRDHRD